MADNDRDEALAYHSEGRPGKIEVVPTKPTATQRDLALAYTPGVAVPCLEIARDPSLVYKYTNKGNLVAVISGAGAAAMACLRLYIKMGLRKENVILTDSHGVIFKGRDVDMTPYKEEFAADTNRRTLAEALDGADVFVGLSVGGIVTPDMI